MQYPHFHLFKRIQHCWYCPMSIIPAEAKFEVFKIMKIFLLCLTSMKLSAAQFSYRIFQRRGKEKGKFRFFAVANNSNFWDVEIGESVLSQVFFPDIVMLVGQPDQEGMSREIIYVDIQTVMIIWVFQSVLFPSNVGIPQHQSD